MTNNERISHCWRLLMSAWARRWKVIRRDALESARANYLLQQAIQCREKSKEIYYETLET